MTLQNNCTKTSCQEIQERRKHDPKRTNNEGSVGQRTRGNRMVQPSREPGVTEWCSPAVWVPKGDNARVRLCTDYRELNKLVKRNVHPFPSTAKYFAKMDAVHGYFQLALDEESSKLTTFLLPQGKFRYTRAPMVRRMVQQIRRRHRRSPIDPENDRQHPGMGRNGRRVHGKN